MRSNRSVDADSVETEDRLESAIRRFDRVVADGAGVAERLIVGFELLAVAAEVGGDWQAVLDPTRRRQIEEVCATPEERLDLLELLAFAPETTGLPAEARVRAEELGHRHAAAPDTARAAERLLHALAAPAAAYRVERSRKAAARGNAPADRRPDRAGAVPDFAGLVVLVAGGHPALRVRVGADLRRAGSGAVRELPAAWEATRRERDVRALVAGIDVAVLIGRQIAHSTVELVKTAAEAAGVPVVVAETAGAGAVHRAIARHLTEGPRRGHDRGGE